MLVAQDEIAAEDRLAILDLMNRYHHLHDYIGPLKGKAMASLFSLDGELGTPYGNLVGRAAIEQAFGNASGTLLGPDKLLGWSGSLNPILKQIAPDRVIGRSMSLTCRQINKLPENVYDLAIESCAVGVFDDVYVKLVEGWRIRKRFWSITMPELSNAFLGHAVP